MRPGEVVAYTASIDSAGAVLVWYKDELDSLVELSAGERDEAKVEEYAEENRDGYHLESRLGQ